MLDDTIIKYRELDINLGVNSLLSDNNKGTTVRLNEIQLQDLLSHLEENTYNNTKVIIVWIKETFIVKSFLLENPRIKLHFLLLYSPNLNIIERLWHILKVNDVYNKFYLKFSDFNKAINSFFNE